MLLNLYDVNKSLLSASMLLVAASSLYAQNWQSKTIHDGKVSYFRYAEGASLNIRDCNFIKTKSGDIKLLGKCSFIIKESGKEPETITLKENEEYIVVTAKPREKSEIRIEEVELFAKKKVFSEIGIRQEALHNVQAFSIGDVLQQLPGQYVQPFNNTQFKNIVFRTASGASITGSSQIPGGDDYGNKAFGVQLMVNDVVVSNNENMQSANSAYDSPYRTSFGTTSKAGNLTPGQPNYGMDLREIPVVNIESVEVIQGIPDAKYGDLTTGLIKVNTIARQSPLRLEASIKEGTYQFGLNKGFKIKGNQALSISVDYMNSIVEPRSSLVSYNRFSTNAMWSVTGSRLRNKLSFSFSQNISEGKKDPDDLTGLTINSNNKNFSLSNNFTYRLTSKPGRENGLKNLSADVGVSYVDQYSMRKYFLNMGARPYGNATDNSVYYAPYTPPSYDNLIFVEGKPFNLYSNVSLNGRYISAQSKWIHDYSIGFNFRYGDNFGVGRYGTAGQYATTTITKSSVDGARDYNYRDNVLASTQTAFYIQNNIYKLFANKHSLRANLGLRYDLQNSVSTLSPRVNVAYKMGRTSLRLGGGLTSKAPSLNQLYTGPRYIDLLLGDYRLPGYYTVGIMQTVVTPGDNVDLKPSKSWKTEVGVDYQLPFASISLTAYYNKLFDGFTSKSVVKEVDKAKVNVNIVGTERPTFEIVGTEKFRYVQTQVVNGATSTDKGLEMMVGFRKIKALNLVPSFNASYVETESVRDNSVLFLKAPEVVDPNFQYGLYDNTGGKVTMARASVSLDYHLPDSGLIIGLRSDNFLLDRRNTYSDSVYPVGYIDYNFRTTMIPENDRQNPKYSNLFRKASEERVSGLTRKTLHNFHLRVTKDFLSGFRVSVYVNNVFNLKPYNESGYEYANFTPISFGANLSYKF